MINSFFKSESEGDLLLCYEGFKYNAMKPAYMESRKIREKHIHRIKAYNMTRNPFLVKWLKENSDVIPPEMGGRADRKKVPQAFLPWNFRAAGWFRKIVTLDYAMSHYGNQYDAIVFLDADAKVTKNLTPRLMDKAFGGKAFFYHWGSERPKKGLGVESGFIGFRTDRTGRRVLNCWIDKYKNKVFRRYMMWDDGGMFGNVVLEMKEREGITGNDLVSNYSNKRRSQSHVIERGMLAEYFRHDKGLHKRLGIVNEK